MTGRVLQPAALCYSGLGATASSSFADGLGATGSKPWGENDSRGLLFSDFKTQQASGSRHLKRLQLFADRMKDLYPTPGANSTILSSRDRVSTFQASLSSHMMKQLADMISASFASLPSCLQSVTLPAGGPTSQCAVQTARRMLTSAGQHARAWRSPARARAGCAAETAAGLAGGQVGAAGWHYY